MKREILILLVVILVLPSLVSAAEHYVDNKPGSNCNDAYTKSENSQSQPWCTIQRAADLLTAGDTVYIREGV